MFSNCAGLNFFGFPNLFSFCKLYRNIHNIIFVYASSLFPFVSKNIVQCTVYEISEKKKKVKIVFGAMQSNPIN